MEVVNQGLKGVRLEHVDRLCSAFCASAISIVPKIRGCWGLHIPLLKEIGLFVPTNGPISCAPLVVESSHGGCKANRKISKAPLLLYLSSCSSSLYIVGVGCAGSVSVY